MFRSVTRSFLIIHMILYIYDFRRSLFASWTREEYKIRWFDISKRVRSHGIGIIASLQLRNLDESHCVAVTRSLYGSRRYVFSFDRSPSSSSRKRRGKKLKTKSIRIRNPTCFGNLANSISASSYSPPRRLSFERKSTAVERRRARFRRDTSDRDDSEFAIVGSKVSRLCPRHNKHGVHRHGDHVARESSVRGRRRAWSLAVTSRTEPRARHRLRK